MHNTECIPFICFICLIFQEYKFTASATLDTTVDITGILTSNRTAIFDPDTGEAALQLNINSEGHFAVIISIVSVPPQYFLETTEVVKVISDLQYVDIMVETLVKVEFRYDEEYNLVRNKEQSFIASFLNNVDLPNDLLIDDVILYAGNYHPKLHGNIMYIN